MNRKIGLQKVGRNTTGASSTLASQSDFVSSQQRSLEENLENQCLLFFS